MVYCNVQKRPKLNKAFISVVILSDVRNLSGSAIFDSACKYVNFVLF